MTKTKSLTLPEIKITRSLNPEEYIQVPNALGFRSSFRGKVKLPVISRVQEYNGMNFEDTHKAIYENTGSVLRMPSPSIFVPHLINVSQAHKSNGEHKLYNAAGETLSDAEVKELYKELFEDSWVWLNAGFEFKKQEGKLQRYLLNYQMEEGKKGSLELKSKTSKLEKCLMKDDVLVPLSLDSFNSQGLPRQRILLAENYKVGENIPFFYSRNNSVAGFDAVSGWAVLYCCRDPSGSNSGLGVFVYAEGVAKNK